MIVKENEENKLFYDTVQGDGYCGMLTLLQEAFDKPKIHLQKFKDRQWVIAKIFQLSSNDQILNEKMDKKFLGMIDYLLAMGNEDLPRVEFLPSSSGLWMGTDIGGSELMKNNLNFNLWVIMKLNAITQRFYQFNGSNDLDCFDQCYRTWKERNFTNNYQNIFHRDLHYFQGPGYTSEFLSNKFDEAIHDLINNIMNYIWPI